MSRETFSYTHGDTGTKPSTSLDFAQNERPDAQNFDWYWYNVVEAIKGHAAEFDRLDSDDDGTVDEADYALDADTVDGEHAGAFADSGHLHDGRYYTQGEADSNFSASGHTHDGRYITESGDTMSGALTLQDGSTAASRSWVNGNADVPNADYANNADQLDGNHAGAFADSGHTHDGRYLNDGTGTVTETNLNFDPAKQGDLHSKYTDSEAVSAVNAEVSLSVDISGDADTVDGNHAGAFADSGHTHDGRYYTESQSDGRYVLESGDTLGGNLSFGGNQATNLDRAQFNNIETVNDGELGVDNSMGFIGQWAGHGMAVLWDSYNVGAGNQINISGGKGDESSPTIAVNDGGGSGLNADMVDGEHASAFANSGHNHDGRYYTESEADSNFSASGHTHDGRYYTESETRGWVNNNADVPNADYADSAGDADTVDGNHAGAFADSNHGNEEHSSTFTTLSEVNNNADVPDADYADEAGNADTVDGQDATDLGVSPAEEYYMLSDSGYDNFQRYDISSDTYTVLADCPAEGNHKAMFQADNGNIYVVTDYGNNHHYEYDISSDSWTELSTWPANGNPTAIAKDEN